MGNNEKYYNNDVALGWFIVEEQLKWISGSLDNNI